MKTCYPVKTFRYAKLMLIMLMLCISGIAVKAQTIGGSLYGGGNDGSVLEKATINIYEGSIHGTVFGGGKQAAVGTLNEQGFAVDGEGNPLTYTTQVIISGDTSSTKIKGTDDYGEATFLETAGAYYFDIGSAGDYYTRIQNTDGTYSYTKADVVDGALCDNDTIYYNLNGGCVFGGGYNGVVNGNTFVSITGGEFGYLHSDITVVNSNDVVDYKWVGSVLGGGYNAAVNGNTNVVIDGQISSGYTPKLVVRGEVMGGGYAAAVTGNTNINFKAGWVFSMFGGGAYGNVGGNTNVIIEPYTGKEYNLVVSHLVFGGGAYANVGGNSSVEITGGYFGYLPYGTPARNPITNSVFVPDNSPFNENGERTSVTYTEGMPYSIHWDTKIGSVFAGGYGLNGQDDGNVGTVGENTTGTTSLTVTGGCFIGALVGGGENGKVTKNTVVDITGTTATTNIFKSTTIVQGRPVFRDRGTFASESEMDPTVNYYIVNEAHTGLFSAYEYYTLAFNANNAAWVNGCTFNSSTHYYSMVNIAVLGGSAYGSVGTETAVVPSGSVAPVCSITIRGGVFGMIDDVSNKNLGTIITGGYAGNVYGNTYFATDADTISDVPSYLDIYENVYAGSYISDLIGNTSMSIDGGYFNNIYGGGTWSDVLGTTYVNIKSGIISGNVFGGGQGGNVFDTTWVKMEGGYLGYIPNGAPHSGLYTWNNRTTYNNSSSGGIISLDALAEGSVVLNKPVSIGYRNNSGSLFGAGYGTGTYVKNTFVELTRGYVFGTLIGGGYSGDVGYMDNGVLVGGDTRVYVSGLATVNPEVLENTALPTSIGGTPLFQAYRFPSQEAIPTGVGYTFFTFNSSYNQYELVSDANGWVDNSVAFSPTTTYYYKNNTACVSGGGYRGAVLGNTYVSIVGGTFGRVHHDAQYLMGMVFGGGISGEVSNNTNVNIDGYPDIYGEVCGGGCMAEVGGNATTSIRGGFIRTVYGGGAMSDVKGNSIVTIGKGNTGEAGSLSEQMPYISQSVYGGGAYGDVLGSTTTVNFLAGYVGYLPAKAAHSNIYDPDFVRPENKLDIVNVANRSNVYGGSYGSCSVLKGSTLVNINPVEGLIDINGSIYGGGELGQINGGWSRYMTKSIESPDNFPTGFYTYDSTNKEMVEASGVYSPNQTYYRYVDSTNVSSPVCVVNVGVTGDNLINIKGAVFGGGRGFAIDREYKIEKNAVDEFVGGLVRGSTEVNIGKNTSTNYNTNIIGLSFYNKEEWDEVIFSKVDESYENDSAYNAERNLDYYVCDESKRYVRLRSSLPLLDVSYYTKSGETYSKVSSPSLITNEYYVKAENEVYVQMLPSVKQAGVEYHTYVDVVCVAGGGEEGQVEGDAFTNVSIGVLGNKNSYTKLINGAICGGGVNADVHGVTRLTIDGHAYVKGEVYGGGINGTVKNKNGEIYAIRTVFNSGWVRNIFGGNSLSDLEQGAIYLRVSDDALVSESIYGGNAYSVAFDSTYVVVDGGRIGYVRPGLEINGGDAIESTETYVPITYGEGNVFGGGFGADSRVKKTEVHINGGLIRGGVFGGAELGVVAGRLGTSGTGHEVTYNYHRLTSTGDAVTGTLTFYNTASSHVYVNGGRMATVYGGGRGFSNYLSHAQTFTPGFIIGDAYVAISDSATITSTLVSPDDGGGSVYGGGMQGAVLGFTKVRINDGTISNDVYGGGRGFPGKKNDFNTILLSSTEDAGLVRGSTEVNINGGQINGSVYGGGEGLTLITTIPTGSDDIIQNDTLGEVRNGATVNMVGGIVKGSVYGGGKDGSVNKAAFVNISNGLVETNVYGGGEQGMVYKNTDNVGTVVNISGSAYIEGSVFGGCLGNTNAVMVSGTRTLNMLGGDVIGSVYGNSQNSSDCINIITPTNDDGSFKWNIAAYANGDDVTADERITDLSFVNIFGGHVYKHVYGGGYKGTVFGSSYVFVGLNACNDAPDRIITANSQKPAILQSTDLTHNLTIDGSIFAASDWGEISAVSQEDTPGATGHTNVFINGQGYNTGAESDFDKRQMSIRNSIYGCGSSTNGGLLSRNIWLRNYGVVTNSTTICSIPSPITVSKSLYTIQRCDTLFVDNTNISLIGKGDVTSYNPTVKYSVYDVNQQWIMAGNSTVAIESPIEEINSMSSMYFAGGEHDYRTLNVAYSPIVPTDVESHRNTLYIEHGSYVALRKTSGENITTFSSLLGYFFFKSNSGYAAFFYARPKTDSQNPGDGGLISFNRGCDGVVNENTFTSAGVAATAPTDNYQFPYTNEPVNLSSNYAFRFWANNSDKTSYRNGVLTAQSTIVKDDAQINTYRTTSCKIALPVVNSGGSEQQYYKVSKVTIDNSIVLLDAGIYNESTTDDLSQWRYHHSGIENTSYKPNREYNNKTLSNLTSDDNMSGNIIAQYDNYPNNNFGLIMKSSDGFNSDTMQIINQNAAGGSSKFVIGGNANEILSLDFILTYNNLLENNVELGNVEIELTRYESDVNGDHPQPGTVTVVLTLITIGDIPQNKQLEMVAVMNNSITENYANFRAKMVLPRINLIEDSQFWISEIILLDTMGAGPTDDPENVYNKFRIDSKDNISSGVDNIVVGDNQIETFAFTFKPSINTDNTDGWYNKGNEVDFNSKITIINDPATSYTGNFNKHTSFQADDISRPLYGTSTNANAPDKTNWISLGTIDGRSIFSVDFNLYYDPSQANSVVAVPYAGTVRCVMVYSKAELVTVGETTTKQTNYYYMNVDLNMRVRTEINKFYLDGVDGSDDNSGKYPNLAKKTLNGILQSDEFIAGDMIYVVNKVTVDQSSVLYWNGAEKNHVHIFRYPGDHVLWNSSLNSECDSLVGFTNTSYEGALLAVKSRMVINDITLNGMYGTTNHFGTNYGGVAMLSEAPLIQVLNGGNLTLLNSTVLEKNYNQISNPSIADTNFGSAVYVAEGGVLQMGGDATIENNIVVVGNQGAVYNDGKMIVGESVKVCGNYIGEGVSRPSNVYLTAPNKALTVARVLEQTGDASFTNNANIGITKALTRDFHFSNPQKYNWYYDVDTTRVAYSLVSSVIQSYKRSESAYTLKDDYGKDIIFDAGLNTHAVFFYSPETYWKDVVTTQPAGYQVDLYSQDVTISSAEGLAWLISEVHGLNGVTHPKNFENINIQIDPDLSTDIDMGAHRWTPIGSSACKFKGDFDGKNKTITNIRVSDNSNYVGLFGYVEDDTISNVSMTGAKVFGNNYVGGIAGYVNNGFMSNNTYNNAIIYGMGYMGGLVGYTQGVTVDGTNNVFNDGSSYNPIPGSKAPEIVLNPTILIGYANYVGGVIGYAKNSRVTNCYVDIENRTKANYTGLVVGYAGNNSFIANNYVIENEEIGSFDNLNGSSSQTKNMGGIAGYLTASTAANNYVVGNINGTQYQGGAIGVLASGASVENCFWGTELDQSVGRSYSGTTAANNSPFSGTGVDCFVDIPVNGDSSLVDILNHWISIQPDPSVYYSWIPDAHYDYRGYPVFGDEVRIDTAYANYEVDACSQYLWHDSIYTENCSYTFTERDDYHYVDSILTLTLTIHQPTFEAFEAEVCQGSDYVGYGFVVPADSTMQVDTLVLTRHFATQYGCDSVRQLSLVVKPVYNTEFSAEICQGESYSENGFSVSSSDTQIAGMFSFDQQLTSTLGCDSLLHLALTVHELPVLNVVDTLDVLEGDTAVITASGAQSYLWSTGDTTATISFIPTDTIEVTLTGYNEFGCETQTSVVINLIPYDVIHEVELPCNIYPNPTKGMVRVDAYGIKQISIISPIGQIVFEKELNADAYNIDLSQYALGTYMIRVVTNYGVVTKPIIVVR